MNGRNDAAYRHGSAARTGVLLVNLGTPDAPTPAAVRRYLKEFLSDPRVVEIPRPLWWLMLRLLVLPLRPRRSAAAYAAVWTPQGSPLLVHTNALARAVGERVRGAGWPQAEVRAAMRYGRPGLAAELNRLHRLNTRRLLVVPLFPQYSATTTAAVFDETSRVLRRRRHLPEVRFVNDYCGEPGYIDACARRIRAFRDEHGAGDKLLFSFHGLPKRNLLQGDPYHCQCRKTARLIADALSLPDDAWLVAFQSRFGRAEWLRPYTDETLRELARQKTGTVDVFCPGFAVDCLETLEEIAMQNREQFERAGGGQLRYIKALNDTPEHADFLAQLVLRHLRGWEAFAEDDAEEREQSRRRALQLGAPQ